MDMGTGIPIDLNANIADIAIGLSPTGTDLGSPQVVSVSGTGVAQGPLQQQTFTSEDLANNNIWGMVPQQNGFLARLLVTFKDTLLYALNYLRPFGGIPPNQYIEGVDSPL